MILPKREGGFFPEREDFPLLEVTAETGLWYGLLDAEKVHKPKKSMQNNWHMLNLSKWTRKKLYDIQL